MTAPNDAKPLLELLSAIEHERWSHWHKYAVENWTPENIERWNRQAATPYHELNAIEKTSDQNEVLRYWKIIQKLLDDKDARINKLEAQLKLFAEEPGDVLDKWEKLVERNHVLEEALLKWKSIGNGAQLKVLELEREKAGLEGVLDAKEKNEAVLENRVCLVEKDLAQAVEALQEVKDNYVVQKGKRVAIIKDGEEEVEAYLIPSETILKVEEVLSRLADVNRNVISNCVISVWKDGSYRVEQHLDSVYGAQNDSDFLVEIPLQGVFLAPARTEEDPNVVICRTCKKSSIDCTCFEDREQAQVEGEKP